MKRKITLRKSIKALEREQYLKFKNKLPSFAARNCKHTVKSLEQSSNEKAAKYKAGLFTGKKLLDLAGGLGADGFAFSGSFDEVISVDKDRELNLIVRDNFSRLGIENYKRFSGTAEDFIKNGGHYDLIYLDADRRADVIRRFHFEDAEPNILNIKERLFELSETVLLKLSPLIDITETIRQLPETDSIYVVSVKNEVKEILVVMKRDGNKDTSLTAVDIDKEGGVGLYESTVEKYVPEKFCAEGNFFYGPCTALIKAGLAFKYCGELGVYPIATNTNFFISDVFIPDFFGRTFNVVNKLSYRLSDIQKYLKKNNLTSANVSKRNFQITVNKLCELLKIEDGGDDYLFFTTDAEGNKLMFHCRKD